MLTDVKQCDLTKFDSKYDSSLRKFDGKVQSIGSDKTVRDTLLLNFEVQK